MINKHRLLSIVSFFMCICLFAVTISANTIPAKNVMADEITDDTEEDTEGDWEEEYTDIDFTLSDFTITPSVNYIMLNWNVSCTDELDISFFNVMVDVYRSTDGTNYTNIASVESGLNSEMSFTDSQIEKGIYYYYKIKITGYYVGGSYGEYHAYQGVELIYDNNPIALAAEDFVPQLSITALNGRKLKVSWEKTYPYGYTLIAYKLYRSTEKDTGFTLIKSINDLADQYNYSYIEEGFDLGTRLYYKLRVVYEDGLGDRYESNYSNVVTRMITIDKPVITGAVSNKASRMTVSFNKQEEADGYYLYIKKGASGTYKKFKTISVNDKASYRVVKKKLTNGKKYFIRVVAYKNYNGQVLKSASAIGRYVNYYAYKNESYKQKMKRIFGKSTYKYYKSRSAALKHMKSITIKVWDLKDGKYYTRTFTILVHKNIAPTVKQIFREIYKLKGKDRIPIHDIGGFSWRGAGSTSEHNQGLAIDINANENYMIRNGVVQAGSFWKPKKSKYSIPKKCKFVNIMKKYGFDRCIWNYSKTEYVRDYMHFSYNEGR